MDTGKLRNPRMAVLLTGSTGALGSYILDLLVELPQVERVVCLVRSDDGRARQEDALRSRGLKPLPPHGVDFFKADLAQPQLGLSDSLYVELQATITTVLHNGWPVDFNLAFKSFQPALEGVKNLIKFAHSSRYICPFFFISSISVAGSWGSVPGAQKAVPEIELDDWRLARTGYGQSKLVAETLLCEASKMSHVPVSICRVCQVGGPVEHGLQGMWNQREWVPSLIVSCQKLNMVPFTLGAADMLDWVPMDTLARVATELFAASYSDAITSDPPKKRFGIIKSKQAAAACNVYHISNPQEVSWRTLIPIIRQHLGSDLRIVPLIEWVDALRARAESPEASEIPGLKLWDFFDNLRDKAIRFPKARAANLEVKYTRKQSPTLDNLGPMRAEWMDLWLRQWKVKGIIH
ncbi:male sterility protein-domain-containing protein [Xylariales sp. PMI_506]|nr:male sterility protein-domain-containing protein [Xylariales sp. PMI_506]